MPSNRMVWKYFMLKGKVRMVVQCATIYVVKNAFAVQVSEYYLSQNVLRAYIL